MPAIWRRGLPARSWRKRNTGLQLGQVIATAAWPYKRIRNHPLSDAMPSASGSSVPVIPMQKISAYILTFNEAEKINAAVESVLWADEIIVVDSNSTDRTAEIATGLGARVVQVPFKGFGDLRNQAIESCRHEWIFSLDSDERCTESVRDEILGLLAGAPSCDVYRVPRRNYFMGRWIRGSGWYPNFRQPQLFRKGSMRYTLDPVHEGYELLSSKAVGTLANAIWQFPFRNLEEVVRKMNRYSSLGAQKLTHKRVSMAGAFGRALWAFLKHYLLKVGFIDGWAGFVIAFAYFEVTFYRYAKRYEDVQKWGPPASATVTRDAPTFGANTSIYS
jgi:glycosyltransferase involved in cell wall biosynthesis